MMQAVTADDVKKTYKGMWPFMMPVQCMDKRYAVPDHGDMTKLIESCDRHTRMKAFDGIYDCDNFALTVWAEATERWALMEANTLPIPIGRASGFKFQGEVENHTVVTFLSSNGVCFYDPQLEEIWSANNKKDLIILVQM